MLSGGKSFPLNLFDSRRRLEDLMPGLASVAEASAGGVIFGGKRNRGKVMPKMLVTQITK